MIIHPSHALITEVEPLFLKILLKMAFMIELMTFEGLAMNLTCLGSLMPTVFVSGDEFVGAGLQRRGLPPHSLEGCLVLLRGLPLDMFYTLHRGPRDPHLNRRLAPFPRKCCLDTSSPQ